MAKSYYKCLSHTLSARILKNKLVKFRLRVFAKTVFGFAALTVLFKGEDIFYHYDLIKR